MDSRLGGPRHRYTPASSLTPQSFAFVTTRRENRPADNGGQPDVLHRAYSHLGRFHRSVSAVGTVRAVVASLVTKA